RGAHSSERGARHLHDGHSGQRTRHHENAGERRVVHRTAQHARGGRAARWNALHRWTPRARHARRRAISAAECVPARQNETGGTTIVMTRILLIDDHPIVRLGVRRILMEHFNPVFIGEAGDAESGAAQALAEPWDVVILDITMPGAVGLDVLKHIREQRPDLPILVLSIHPANQFARRALSAGASGYLTKDSATGELVGAVEDVRRGRRYVSEAVKATMGSARAIATHETLSDREY